MSSRHSEKIETGEIDFKMYILFNPICLKCCDFNM